MKQKETYVAPAVETIALNTRHRLLQDSGQVRYVEDASSTPGAW